MSRCRACNKVLKDNEMKWDKERGIHEDLCKRCLSEALDVNEEDIAALQDVSEESPTHYDYIFEEPE